MKKFRFYILCVLLLSGRTFAAELSSANLSTTSEGIELHMDFSQIDEVSYTSNKILGNPMAHTSDRFYIDFSPAVLSKKFQAPVISQDSKIKMIRWAQYQKDVVRVVFDLVTSQEIPFQIAKDSAGIKISTIPQTKPEPVAVSDQPQVPVTIPLEKIETKPEIAAALEKISEQVNEQVSEQVNEKPASPKIAKVRKIRVILDAGHGGEDSGALGRRGTREKDVTLDVSKHVRDLLLQEDKYEVFMTRDQDKTLELLDRTKFANKMNGDIFVSIHANANTKSSSKGISTYFLNNADDQESLRVAMRENGELDPTVLKQPSKNTDDYFLEVMKASMVKNFHTVQSTDLARSVQLDLLKTLKKNYSEVVDLGVRSARFYVLTGATMPAILVETSFISNPVEEKRLSDSGYQRNLAKAIVSGIDTFFKNRPAFEGIHNVVMSEKVSRASSRKSSRNN